VGNGFLALFRQFLDESMRQCAMDKRQRRVSILATALHNFVYPPFPVDKSSEQGGAGATDWHDDSVAETGRQQKL
jgi:hypothetical protein